MKTVHPVKFYWSKRWVNILIFLKFLKSVNFVSILHKEDVDFRTRGFWTKWSLALYLVGEKRIFEIGWAINVFLIRPCGTLFRFFRIWEIGQLGDRFSPRRLHFGKLRFGDKMIISPLSFRKKNKIEIGPAIYVF